MSRVVLDAPSSTSPYDELDESFSVTYTKEPPGSKKQRHRTEEEKKKRERRAKG